VERVPEDVLVAVVAGRLHGQARDLAWPLFRPTPQHPRSSTVNPYAAALAARSLPLLTALRKTSLAPGVWLPRLRRFTMASNPLL
jgi:hypothetical protein